MKTYRYVDGEYEVEIEIKRSIFIATVKGELNADEADEFVKSVRKRYPDATHNCYAYVGDELGNVTRFSDDGEPSGTAGQPILDVLRKQNIVKTAIVVTRYFGGIKLGAGGLVGAYSGAAADGVKAGKISQKVECALVEIKSDYPTHATVEKLLRKSNVLIDEVAYCDEVTVKIFVPLDDKNSFIQSVNESSLGRSHIVDTGIVDFKKLD